MFKFIKGIFSRSATKTLENIASEWIQTDMEKAEAKTLMIKTLDPNGKMRRDISRNILILYSIYIITMLVLIILEFFGVGQSIDTATVKLTDLFMPITGMVTAIVGGSFGVNFANVTKNN